jgi:hypothetical protein
MTKNEIRMTNETANSNDESQRAEENLQSAMLLLFRHSGFDIHSTFGFRPSSFLTVAVAAGD